MGVNMSTLVGYAVLFAAVGAYVAREQLTKRAQEAAKAAAQRHKLEERQNLQNRKESKEKAKKQRVEAYSKSAEIPSKSAQVTARTSKTTSAPVHTPDFSSDDGVDNREFARQLVSVKQGTNLNAPKKTDEKRQKSVKQSRAREIEPAEDKKVSAPSSTAGADADDDESSIASPEVSPADAGDVTDMLEPKTSGPSVLRLTGTDKAKKKEKKAKAPEKVESKKQRQNRQKAEAAKAEREEQEKNRQVALEAHRREVRIAEGRPAKDGSAFMASQAAQSVWKGTGANTGSTNSLTNGEYVPVQPLDTFDTSSHTDVSVSKATPQTTSNADSWMSSLPSEEEQMEILRDSEAWSTVTTKKSKGKKKEKTPEPEHASAQPEQAAATTTQPAKPKANINGTGQPAKSFTQASSFAALSAKDEPEVELEWDV
ncbi:hypothetical protein OQA88_1513 [Cercophora sp. LCS_1]